MIGESHLCQVLQAEEIDTSFIDPSLSYAENCQNLYKQFGIRFRQFDYAREFKRAESKANDYNKDAIIIKPERIIKADKPKAKASQKRYGEFKIIAKVER